MLTVSLVVICVVAVRLRFGLIVLLLCDGLAWFLHIVIVCFNYVAGGYCGVSVFGFVLFCLLFGNLVGGFSMSFGCCWFCMVWFSCLGLVCCLVLV